MSNTGSNRANRGSSGRSCAVLKCHNNWRKIHDWKLTECEIHAPLSHEYCACEKPYSLHRFPGRKEFEGIRRQWVKNINRKDFEVKDHSVVCGIHFPDGLPTDENPYPILHMGYDLPKEFSIVRAPPKRRSPRPKSEASTSAEKEELWGKLNNLQEELKEALAKQKELTARHDSQAQAKVIKEMQDKYERQLLLHDAHMKQLVKEQESSEQLEETSDDGRKTENSQDDGSQDGGSQDDTPQETTSQESVPISKRKKRSRRRCGHCKPCRRQIDCGKCDFCLDMKKFGGPNKQKQKCRLKQCLREAKIHAPISLILNSQHHNLTDSSSSSEESEIEQEIGKEIEKMKKRLLMEQRKKEKQKAEINNEDLEQLKTTSSVEQFMVDGESWTVMSAASGAEEDDDEDDRSSLYLSSSSPLSSSSSSSTSAASSPSTSPVQSPKRQSPQPSSSGFAVLPERQAKVATLVSMIDRMGKGKEGHKEKPEETGDEPKDDENALAFCLCKSTDYSQFIISCDYCAKLYHGKCVGVEELAAKFIRKYACPPCRDKDPDLTVVYGEIPAHLETDIRLECDETDVSDKQTERTFTSTHQESKKEKRKAITTNQGPKRKKMMRIRMEDCGVCTPCTKKEDCGQCIYCKTRDNLKRLTHGIPPDIFQQYLEEIYEKEARRRLEEEKRKKGDPLEVENSQNKGDPPEKEGHSKQEESSVEKDPPKKDTPVKAKARGRSNRIQRKCELCEVVTNAMSKHLAGAHKLDKEERWKYIFKARARVPIHQKNTSGKRKGRNCPLCEGKHYAKLKRHLVGIHKLTPEEARLTLKGISRDHLGRDSHDKEQSHDKGDPPGKEDPPEKEGHSEQEESLEKKKDPPEKDFLITARATGKSNRIQRKCELCEVVTNDMSKHLERVHKLNKEERWKYIYKARARVPIHWKNSSGKRMGDDCPLCDGKHYAKLKRHLIGMHKLTPEEARLNLKKQKGISGRSNRIERKCELCEVVTNDMSKHLERVHKLNKEERWKYIHKARARVPIHWKNSSLEQKGKNCPLCEGKNYAKLKRHLIGMHKLTPEEARLTLKKQKGISGDPPGKEHSHDIGDSPGKEDYYDKVDPPGKEHSHDKGEPPGKEHSHDKGDSPGKEDSHDEGDYPGKEDSHDKGDSPGKEHSYDEGDSPGKEDSHDKEDPIGKEDPPEEEGHSEQEESLEKKYPPEKDFSTTAKATGRSSRIERKCELCEVVTNDMSKHLQRVHKLNKEDRWKYIHKARARVPIHWKNSSGERKGRNFPLCEGKHYAKLKRHLIDIHKLTPEKAMVTLKRQKGISVYSRHSRISTDPNF